MKKDSKTIKISGKKAGIIGLIMSFVFSIIISYASADIMIRAGLRNGEISVFTLGNILIPIIFVIFGTFIFAFILFCGIQNKNN